MNQESIFVNGIYFTVVLGKNLIDSDADVIAHQTNCLGIMGSGVAVAIKRKWPEVFREYRLYCHEEEPLGTTQLIKISESQYVANVFGQYSIGREQRQTDYNALKTALQSLKNQMQTLNLKFVAFPVYMGAARGGGSWESILNMILEVFKFSGISIELDAYWGADAEDHFLETVRILADAKSLTEDP